LLIGRENLGNGEIESGEIKNNKIKDDEEDIKIADYKKFFLKYINRCAVSVQSANLIIDRAEIEIASTY
jgi:hypothetical protein